MGNDRAWQGPICAGITLRREQQEKRKVAMSVKQVVLLLNRLRGKGSLELATGNPCRTCQNPDWDIDKY
jgi:hypothetical protein